MHIHHTHARTRIRMNAHTHARTRTDAGTYNGRSYTRGENSTSDTGSCSATTAQCAVHAHKQPADRMCVRRVLYFPCVPLTYSSGDGFMQATRAWTHVCVHSRCVGLGTVGGRGTDMFCSLSRGVDSVAYLPPHPSHLCHPTPPHLTANPPTQTNLPVGGRQPTTPICCVDCVASK